YYAVDGDEAGRVGRFDRAELCGAHRLRDQRPVSLGDGGQAVFDKHYSIPGVWVVLRAGFVSGRGAGYGHGLRVVFIQCGFGAHGAHHAVVCGTEAEGYGTGAGVVAEVARVAGSAWGSQGEPDGDVEEYERDWAV